MDIRTLTEPEELKALVRRQPLQPFLQTWAWGEFQSAVGRKIWRLGAYQGNHLVGAATVIEHRLILDRSYLYVPRGPLADTPEVFQALLAHLRQLGTTAQAMYIKVDLGKYSFPTDQSLWVGFELGTTLQPQQTLIIHPNQPRPELLSAMHPKTRYNIRLAEKRCVTVRWSTTDADFDVFLRLIQDTYKRQSIRLHPPDYYRKLFTTLRSAQMCDLALAEYHGQVVAANLVVWNEQTVTYLHGGSSTENKEVMAPHLLQWRTIEKARSRGCTDYDLWGVAPDHQAQHQLSGVTRFKKGFGGHLEVFSSSINLVLQPSWYWAYRLAKRMRGGVDA